jgi:hypothetical protein
VKCLHESSMRKSALMKRIHSVVYSKRTLCWTLIIVFVSHSFTSCAGGNFLGVGRGDKYVYSYKMMAPRENSNMIYQDERIKVQFRIDDSAIRFQLQNLSRESACVQWNKASLGVENQFSAIRTSVSFYADTPALSESALIPPLGYIQEIAIPYHNIRFNGDQWIEQDFFPTVVKGKLPVAIMKNIGKSIVLVLPIQFGTAHKDYLFNFRVEAVHKIAWSDYRRPRRNPPPTPQRPKASVTDQVTTAIVAVGLLGFAAYIMTIKKDPLSE